MAQPTDLAQAVSSTTTVAGGSVAVLSADLIISLVGGAVMIASFAYNIWHTSKMREIARTKE